MVILRTKEWMSVWKKDPAGADGICMSDKGNDRDQAQGVGVKKRHTEAHHIAKRPAVLAPLDYRITTQSITHSSVNKPRAVFTQSMPKANILGVTRPELAMKALSMTLGIWMTMIQPLCLQKIFLV